MNVINTEPMRRYFFTNMYMGGIHTGIQSGHAAEEMWANVVRSFLTSPTEYAEMKLKYLLDFAENHKTWIILNGGDHYKLSEFYQFLINARNPYTFSSFQEPGLNGAITSVSVILPERMWDETATYVGNECNRLNGSSQQRQLDFERRVFCEGVPTYKEGVLILDSLGKPVLRTYSQWEIDFLKRKVLYKLAQ